MFSNTTMEKHLRDSILQYLKPPKVKEHNVTQNKKLSTSFII